jgi:hypothetical protein
MAVREDYEAESKARLAQLTAQKRAEVEANGSRIVIIDYTNWRGERRKRRVYPILGTLRFTETPHHKPAQWVFNALDLERDDQALRTFALANVHSWEPT